MTMQTKIEPDLDDIEKALAPPKLPKAKSFAPPQQQGVHELIAEIDDMVSILQNRVTTLKQRLAEFDRLQTNFYNGTTP
jgi:hypothetical protein